MSYLFYSIFSLGVIYGLVALGIFICQRRLIYHPDTLLHPPHHYKLEHLQLLTLSTADAEKITAWYHPAPQQHDPVMLYLHGNKGHIGDRSEKLAAFSQHMGLLAISYRGFGTSSGTATEQGLYKDARAALNYLLRDHQLNNIIIYGESLGTGVAVQMATEFSVGGVILEAPYISLTARGAVRYPYLPVSRLMKDRFDSLSKINLISSPLLILHGEEDETIPVSDGKTLFAVANEPKEAIFFPAIHHTDFSVDELVGATTRFIQKYQR
jgi:pimeloyl-ACP methyl ester carboxylesterase